MVGRIEGYTAKKCVPILQFVSLKALTHDIAVYTACFMTLYVYMNPSIGLN